MVANMIQAGYNAATTSHEDELIAFECFSFELGVTIAHEIMHIFAAFLIGDTHRSTPPPVTFIPELYNEVGDDGIEYGESGRAWEGRALGGIVQAFESRSSILGARQAGILYLVDANSIARPLDHNCIRRCLSLSKSFNLLLSRTLIN